jgi:hypothetical protein
MEFLKSNMKKPNRRKFLFAGLSLAALLATLRFTTKKRDEKKTTLKFLTQDGRLVEVDASKMPAARQTATKQDLQNWVKKNKSL